MNCDEEKITTNRCNAPFIRSNIPFSLFSSREVQGIDV